MNECRVDQGNKISRGDIKLAEKTRTSKVLHKKTADCGWERYKSAPTYINLALIIYKFQ